MRVVADVFYGLLGSLTAALCLIAAVVGLAAAVLNFIAAWMKSEWKHRNDSANSKDMK